MKKEGKSMIIRWGSEMDAGALQAADRLVSQDKLQEALAQKRVLVAMQGELLLGCLRFSWFWDSIPFMNLLFVLSPHRHQGIGSLLVRHWEESMQEKGHALVMTSTRVDEEAQHFFRGLGYRDAGALFLPEEPAELVLLKRLAEI